MCSIKKEVAETDPFGFLVWHALTDSEACFNAKRPKIEMTPDLLMLYLLSIKCVFGIFLVCKTI